MKKITFTFLIPLLFSAGLFAQVNSTGQVEFAPVSSGLPYGAQIDVTANEVTLYLAGPADRWLGIGFGVSSMTNGGDVVIYSGGTSTNTLGTLSDRTFIGIGATPSNDANQDWTLITKDITTQPGARILVATRALNTGEADDYVFNLTDTSINLVWARGNGSLNLGYHGSSNKGVTAAGFTLGVDDYSLSKFKISPNPVTSAFKIELPSTINSANLEVYDVLGKKIYANKISNFESNIDSSSWNNGIYLVRVISGDVSQTKRIIKQ